jgi:hypothetical protein
LVNYHDDRGEFDMLGGKLLTDRKVLEDGVAQNCQLCHHVWRLVLEQALFDQISSEGNL